jgi:hypothetical protein
VGVDIIHNGQEDVKVLCVLIGGLGIRPMHDVENPHLGINLTHSIIPPH